MSTSDIFQFLQSSTGGTDYQHQINVGKWVAIPLIFFLILIACLIPHVLIKLKRGAATAIAFCTCVSGGALLGIGLMHILPHANEYWTIWLDPCADHSGHQHNVAAPVTPIIVDAPETDEPSLSSLRLLHVRNSFTLDRFQGIEARAFEPTQSITPVDPGTFIPTPLPEAHVDCPDELFPYAQLCCGLVIMLLMATESFLHTYLAGRGSEGVHLHDHGDEPCAHGHDHGDAHDHHDHDHDHHDHDHGHDHHHHHHNDHHGQNHHNDHHHPDHHVSDCPDQVIELQPTQQPEATTEAPAKTEGHSHHHHEGEEAPNKIVETVEGNNTDEGGQKLSAEEIERLRFRRTIDAYISAIAISLHCVFNGLSLGVYTATDSSQRSEFWTLFGATVGHKLMDGFAVGIPLFRANLPRITNAIIMVIVAISTPVGILIGYFASNVKNNGRYLAQAILLSLSAGSFFYISLLEMIPSGVKIINKRRWMVSLQWLAVGIGFAISAVIAKWA